MPTQERTPSLQELGMDNLEPIEILEAAKYLYHQERITCNCWEIAEGQMALETEQDADKRLAIRADIERMRTENTKSVTMQTLMEMMSNDFDPKSPEFQAVTEAYPKLASQHQGTTTKEIALAQMKVLLHIRKLAQAELE